MFSWWPALSIKMVFINMFLIIRNLLKSHFWLNVTLRGQADYRRADLFLCKEWCFDYFLYMQRIYFILLLNCLLFGHSLSYLPHWWLRYGHNLPQCYYINFVFQVLSLSIALHVIVFCVTFHDNYNRSWL